MFQLFTLCRKQKLKSVIGNSVSTFRNLMSPELKLFQLFSTFEYPQLTICNNSILHKMGKGPLMFKI